MASLECELRVTKIPIIVNELLTPVGFAYDDLRILDSDDFPDGTYEVNFEGGSEKVSKWKGSYI